jgi:N-acetylglucosaminyldiphosphoundecaprenol N-acetyl-beta-D-mannosaminyltransferase
MNDSSVSRSNLTAPPIAILGVPFDNVTTAETIARVERMVISRRPHYLVTANVNFLVQAQSDMELHRAMLDAHLVLGSGNLLVFASRLLGNPLPGQMVGTDLMPLLAKVAADKQYRLFFLGAAQESTERAIASLKSKYPALKIAGQCSPPPNKRVETDYDEIKRRIEEAKPDVLFVSLGRPTQEKWIARHYRSLGVPVAIGVGTKFDFLAGQVAPAPDSIQRSAPGWLFCLARATRLVFRHYVQDVRVFGCALLLQWWQFRSSRTHPTRYSFPVQAEETWRSIKLPERLDSEAVHNDALLLEQVLADGRHCLLEMADVKFIDSTGVGLLIRLQKKIHATGRQLVLLAPSQMAQHALKLMQLQDFFMSAPDLAAAQKLIEARAKE